MLVTRDRGHGAKRGTDPAGRPGPGPGQSERHVPRGGGVDGGYPAHTGGGSGSGLRHILFIYTKAVWYGLLTADRVARSSNSDLVFHHDDQV